ncbi:MAG: hypothetical protein ABII00_09615 [Elusimicrobiota bacterium]
MKRALVIGLALASFAAVAHTASEARIRNIRIDIHDQDACKSGPWIGINFSVRTDDGNTMRHRIHASCGYTLNKRYEEDGIECKATSGMCTGYGFYGSRGEIEIECRAGRYGHRRRETATFTCPSD